MISLLLTLVLSFALDSKDIILILGYNYNYCRQVFMIGCNFHAEAMPQKYQSLIYVQVILNKNVINNCDCMSLHVSMPRPDSPGGP